MALREEKVLLLIADISGYTDFMLANEKSLEHSHIIISELIETILNEVQLPLSLAKLEGDAIFLYAVKDDAFAGRAADLGARVLRFFHVFSNKVAELTLSSFCKCGACTNIERLKLKVVVHSGRCAFYQIANLTELSGVDVIIVHRLLKNSVGMSEYILLTEAAEQDLQLPLILLSKGEETYDAIGALTPYVYSSPDKPAYVPDPTAPAPSLFLETLRCEIKREYAEVATNPTKGFHFHTGRTLATLLGYSDQLLEGIPEESISRLAGTGNPFALGALRAGETVVELGCGAGMDTLIASRMVGPNGRVLAIDMTTEMLDEARNAASSMGATNLDFPLGSIKSIPRHNDSVNLIISPAETTHRPDKIGKRSARAG